MKKSLSLVLAFVLAMTMLVGIASAEEGKILNIWCWNTEFQSRFNDYYPEVKEIAEDKSTTTLNDGTIVKWTINPNENNNYQNKLDEALLAQESAAADEKIDIFLIEADYALKYVDSDYTLPLEEIGITADQLAKQYPYTVTVATDSNGQIKGSSWQAAPGLFLYRRSLAEKYLGVKSPEEMQEKVKDWDAFLATAREVNEKSAGATKLIPSNGDVWQVVRTVRSTPWVDEAYNLVIDDQVKWYFDFAKPLRDENLTAMATPWTEAWNAGVGNDSIMGYFFSTWGIQWTMVGNSGGSKPGEGTYGDWAAVNGPQPYYWGGTWLTAATTCCNKALAKDIIEYFTIETGSMQDYCLKSKDYVNNTEAIQAIIDAGFAFDFLGGQDHYSLFQAVTPLIDISAMSAYDQNINICMDAEVNAYASGEKDYETAIQDFKDAVVDMYPELTAE